MPDLPPGVRLRSATARETLWLMWLAVTRRAIRFPCCATCAYPLRGLTQAVCPECGAALGTGAALDPTIHPWGLVARVIGVVLYSALCMIAGALLSVPVDAYLNPVRDHVQFDARLHQLPLNVVVRLRGDFTQLRWFDEPRRPLTPLRLTAELPQRGASRLALPEKLIDTELDELAVAIQEDPSHPLSREVLSAYLLEVGAADDPELAARLADDWTMVLRRATLDTSAFVTNVGSGSHGSAAGLPGGGQMTALVTYNRSPLWRDTDTFLAWTFLALGWLLAWWWLRRRKKRQAQPL